LVQAHPLPTLCLTRPSVNARVLVKRDTENVPVVNGLTGKLDFQVGHDRTGSDGFFR